MRTITHLAVHCSATKPSADIGAEEIRQWHVRDNKWADIGYHRVIKRDGTVEFGRSDSVPGAHAAGYNTPSLAVCLIGGVDENGKPAMNYTVEQLRSLEVVLRQWRKQYPATRILGHRDYPGVAKACPCFDVADWCWTRRIDPGVRACA